MICDIMMMGLVSDEVRPARLVSYAFLYTTPLFCVSNVRSGSLFSQYDPDSIRSAEHKRTLSIQKVNIWAKKRNAIQNKLSHGLLTLDKIISQTNAVDRGSNAKFLQCKENNFQKVLKNSLLLT